MLEKLPPQTPRLTLGGFRPPDTPVVRGAWGAAGPRPGGLGGGSPPGSRGGSGGRQPPRDHLLLPGFWLLD